MGASRLGKILAVLMFWNGPLAAGQMTSDIATGLSWDFGCIELPRLCFTQINVFKEIKENLPIQISDILQQMKKMESAIGRTAGLTVKLNSPGGDVDAALAVGRQFRTAGANIDISPEHECASSCVFLLMAGSSRYVEGRVAMHRPFLVGGDATLTRVTAARRAMATKLSNYATEMNVSVKLIDDMLNIPSDDARLLRPTELFAYGVREIDPAQAETENLKTAQMLGISHREVVARMSRAREVCSVGLNPNPFIASAELKISQCYVNIVYR